MSIRELLTKFWNDVFPDNVIYLSVYKLERSRKYPLIGFRFFSDFLFHRRWMREESKRLTREEHNKRVSEKYKPKPLNPNGSPQ